MRLYVGVECSVALPFSLFAVKLHYPSNFLTQVIDILQNLNFKVTASPTFFANDVGNMIYFALFLTNQQLL